MLRQNLRGAEMKRRKVIKWDEIQKMAMEEGLNRPNVEIWPDPVYDEWAEWVRSHERRKTGNPVDLCEINPRLRASPLCPIGYH